MVTSGTASTGSCAARCALAGNPSDGHGGAVVATTIEAIRARVIVSDSDVFRIDGSPSEFRSVEELATTPGSGHAGRDDPLIPATLVALERHLGADLRPVRIAVETTIPRSVGLAGSSAIVIATMRALAAADPGAPWAHRIRSDPTLVASLALAAERDVLGIAAGLQDRVVQSFGGTVSMEFGTDQVHDIDGLRHRLRAGTYRSVPSPPGALVVAFRPDAGADSGAVHGRVDRSDPAFGRAMENSAEQARRAVRAIESGDHVALGRAMDATFDLRASVMELDRRHVEMIELARRHGASANYTGSGGAIVLLTADHESMTPVRAALRRELGCRDLVVN